jgi:hypothetical protein
MHVHYLSRELHCATVSRDIFITHFPFPYSFWLNVHEAPGARPGVRQATQAHTASVATVRLLVLGKRLRDLRVGAGKSLEDAAAALGVSAIAIRRIEQGQVK